MHAPLDPLVRAEWRGLAALDAVADEWRALAERALEPNVFYEPPFLSAAAPVFGAGAGAVLVWSGARLLGLFPLRIARRHEHPVATAVGWIHPFAPLGTPLVDRDAAEGVIAAALDHLAGDPAMPDYLLLPLLPEARAFAAALDAVLERSNRRSAAFDRHARALLQPGTGRDGYLERAVPARKRKELRRQRRRLEDFAPVTFTRTAATADVENALQDFLVLEASGWKGLAGTAIVNSAAVRDFVRTAVMGLAAEGRARIVRLFLNSRAIAAAVELRSGDTAWLWKIAYNEGLGRYSPGVQLVLDATESLLAERGLAHVDSCALANHPMIDHIWRERLPLSDRLIALRRPVVPFALACRIEMMRRAAIAAAKALRRCLRGR